MNQSADYDADTDEQQRSHRVRFELIFASLWLAFGLFLLPALIYWVGAAMLGPYRENAGLSTFYIDFYGDLADAAGRAWVIALGPALLMYLLRAVFIGARPKAPDGGIDLADDSPIPPPSRRTQTRREPRREPDVETPRKESKRPAPRSRVEPRMSND